MWGSQHNDPIVDTKGKTARNAAGGINGGITNGNPVVFRVAVKPTSSISLPQKTINLTTGAIQELVIEGRHDTCFALRVPVVLEAAAAIVVADLLLADNRSRNSIGN
jgi:chorismate synthase